MARNIKRQVLALRPNARVVETRFSGLIIMDGEQVLDGEDGPVWKEDQAWYRAFQWLMVRYRAGIDRP